jgi:CRP/FNR family cyclic AMP-dependent transcriptional regulator
MSADIEMLGEVSLFALLDQKERKTLAKLLDTKAFSKGDTIFSYGDAGDALYLIRHGRVEVFVENTEGQKIILAENEPGDLFGEISLLDGGARTASVVGETPLVLLELKRSAFHRMLREEPGIAAKMLVHLASMLRRLDMAAGR